MDEIQLQPNNPLPIQPEFQTSMPTSTTPVKSKNVLVLLLAIITLSSLGLAGFFGYKYWRYQLQPITTYEECVKANGNQTTLMFPGTCTTRDGRQFTEPLTDEEKKNFEPPTDPTANWKTYTNESVGLSFKYPPTLSLKISDKGLYFVDVTGLFQTNISWNKSTSPLEEEIKGRDLCPKEVTNGIVVGPIANSLRCDFIKSHYASVDIWIMNGNNLYKATIGAINPNTPIPVESITLLNQILSTFKFLDVTGKSCQSDVDCGSGYICIVATGTQQMDRNGKPVDDLPKTCYPKDAPLPQ